MDDSGGARGSFVRSKLRSKSQSGVALYIVGKRELARAIDRSLTQTENRRQHAQRFNYYLRHTSKILKSVRPSSTGPHAQVRRVQNLKRAAMHAARVQVAISRLRDGLVFERDVDGH
eukprot:4905083-Pleurochrysis_carterae.AAC.2